MLKIVKKNAYFQIFAWKKEFLSVRNFYDLDFIQKFGSSDYFQLEQIFKRNLQGVFIG
jgi:hypothetical protein